MVLVFTVSIIIVVIVYFVIRAKKRRSGCLYFCCFKMKSSTIVVTDESTSREFEAGEETVKSGPSRSAITRKKFEKSGADFIRSVAGSEAATSILNSPGFYRRQGEVGEVDRRRMGKYRPEETDGTETMSSTLSVRALMESRSTLLDVPSHAGPKTYQMGGDGEDDDDLVEVCDLADRHSYANPFDAKIVANSLGCDANNIQDDSLSYYVNKYSPFYSEEKNSTSRRGSTEDDIFEDDFFNSSVMFGTTLIQGRDMGDDASKATEADEADTIPDVNCVLSAQTEVLEPTRPKKRSVIYTNQSIALNIASDNAANTILQNEVAEGGRACHSASVILVSTSNNPPKKQSRMMTAVSSRSLHNFDILPEVAGDPGLALQTSNPKISFSNHHYNVCSVDTS